MVQVLRFFLSMREATGLFCCAVLRNTLIMYIPLTSSGDYMHKRLPLEQAV